LHRRVNNRDKQLDFLSKQGRQLYGVELKIVNDEGKELPRDGNTPGDLLVRGPWVTKSYYREGKLNVDEDNWFVTGDVAKICPGNFIHDFYLLSLNLV
jgi:acyl-CoA synthetase (AMP-forming)/AMP-acid ligase II